MERLIEKLMACGIAAHTLGGERASGDQCLVHPFREGVLIAVVDGLGHGSEAAEAASTALTTLKGHAGEPVLSLVKRCQAELVGTRGAAMSIASFNVIDSTMAWLGVGNVEGVLVRAKRGSTPEKEFLLLGRGVVGGQLPKLQAFVVPVVGGDTLTFATDGVTSNFHDEINVREPPQRIADRVLSGHGKDSDDALVLVARFLGNSQ